MGWRMTVSVHQLSRKGSEDDSMPQAELDNTRSVPEKKKVFSWTCKQKYSLKNRKPSSCSVLERLLLCLGIMFQEGEDSSH